MIHHKVSLVRSLALAAGLGLAFAGAAGAQERLKIGALLSATGPGAFAGQSSTVGLKMALADINRAGGILGKQVDLVSADDASDPSVAVSEAIRLTAVEKVNFIYGPQLSQLAIAAAPKLNEAKVVWISTTTASQQLTTTFAPQHFSLLFTAESQGDAIASSLIARGYKRVAIIGDDNLTSKQINASTAEALKKKGITVTGAEEFRSADTDTTPQLLSLRKGNPEALFIQAPTGETIGRVVKNLNEIGWNVVIVGGPAFSYLAQAAARIAGADAFAKAEGLVYKGTSACPNDPQGVTPFAKFLVKLKAFDATAHEKLSRQNIAAAYDGLHILKAAAEAVKSTDGPQMAKWIEANVSKLDLIYAPLQASPTDHFMIGADAQTLGVNLSNLRADGLQYRAGC